MYEEARLEAPCQASESERVDTMSSPSRSFGTHLDAGARHLRDHTSDLVCVVTLVFLVLIRWERFHHMRAVSLLGVVAFDCSLHWAQGRVFRMELAWQVPHEDVLMERSPLLRFRAIPAVADFPQRRWLPSREELCLDCGDPSLVADH